jgi:hypothetical protein
MDTKEIIILVCMLLALGFSMYKRLSGKNKKAGQVEKQSPFKKGGLSSQPDDYEPYSKKKS